jgi:hypothetical protein
MVASLTVMLRVTLAVLLVDDDDEQGEVKEDVRRV